PDRSSQHRNDSCHCPEAYFYDGGIEQWSRLAWTRRTGRFVRLTLEQRQTGKRPLPFASRQSGFVLHAYGQRRLVARVGSELANRLAVPGEHAVERSAVHGVGVGSVVRVGWTDGVDVATTASGASTVGSIVGTQ